MLKAGMVSLITRPKQFGKSTNLTMIEQFFDIESSSEETFKKMNIFNEEKFWDKHFKKYPVIRLNFESLEDMDTMEKLKKRLKLILKYNFDSLKIKYQLDLNFEELEIDDDSLDWYILKMCQILFKKYNKNCIVLIDDYERFLEDAVERNENAIYFDSVCRYFSHFYGSIFRSNLYLFKGCLTGILKLSGLFSHFGNAISFSILDNEFNDKFGFTQKEVDKFIQRVEFDTFKIEAIKDHYNGYYFAGCKVYNPWSVMQALQRKKIEYYWLNDNNEYLLNIFKKTSPQDRALSDLNMLITSFTSASKSMIYIFNENLTYQEQFTSNQFLLILLHSGYVTILEADSSRVTDLISICIPNMEIFQAFKNVYNYLIKFKTETEHSTITDYLFNLDLVKFKYTLENSILRSSSYYDFNGSDNEKSYHILMYGILLNAYNQRKNILRSNREAGLGRYDLVLEHNVSKNLFIFEFKVSKVSKNLKKGATNAIKQIEEKKYSCEVIDTFDKKTYIGICFCGKECLVHYKLFSRNVDSKKFEVIEEFPIP
jgi:hypothetical protein